VSVRTLSRIAVAVFRESVRDRVLYNLAGFALLVIGASYLIGQLTAGQDVKIIKDLGLAAMAVFGLFIAIFIGIGLVSKEVERRSIYSLIAKPVRRSELVVGKYLGLVLTIAINLAVMAIVWYGVLGYMSWVESEQFKSGWEAAATDPRMLVAVYLIFVQLMLVIAIALFFSTFSSPMLSATFAFGLYVAGHFSADLKNFDVAVGDSPIRFVTAALYYVLPNMAVFDVKNAVVHAQPVPLGYVLTTTAYGLCYVTVLVAAGVWIFSRRDFK
jgi:Cu-processing system permease protein